MFPRLKRKNKTIWWNSKWWENSRCWQLEEALLSDPELLMLDEPSMGLAPIIIEEYLSPLEK